MTMGEQMNEELDQEELAEESVAIFNEVVKKLEEKVGRPATVEEMEYIRERVMLGVFGFYEREKAEDV